MEDTGASCTTYDNAAQQYRKPLLAHTTNPCIQTLEYFTHCPVIARSKKIEEELSRGVPKPFSQLVKASSGDCHANGQTPLTFVRQVLAMALDNSLLNDPRFPSDAKERACRILDACSGKSLGNYTYIHGLEIIRQDAARFIEERDNCPCDWKNLFICGGAVDAIKLTLETLSWVDERGMKTGIMVGIPQFPLFGATMSLQNIHQIPFDLSEENNWSMDFRIIQRALDEARNVCIPRAIIAVNPGNPTGRVLTRTNIEELVRFAHRERLLIIADEVYQDNVLDDSCEFVSVRKVLIELGSEFADQQLVSIVSVSKGLLGECGLRGGFYEVHNFDEDVKQAMWICGRQASTVGQAAVECYVNPPRPGEPSYQVYTQEKQVVCENLKRKARLVSSMFQSIDGIHCSAVQGSMYCFPCVDLPKRAIQYAEEVGMTPDTFYCLEVLENTGLVLVPGSCFGQKPGTYHFRCTILPPEQEFRDVMSLFKDFHASFLQRWS